MNVEEELMNLIGNNPDNYLLTDALDFYAAHGFLCNFHYTAIQKNLRDPGALTGSRNINNFGMVI